LRNFSSGTRNPKVNDQSAEPVAKPEFKESLSRKDGETSADQSLASGQPLDTVAESTVRVKIDRLDKLLDTVGELVIAQTMVGQDELIVNGIHHELVKRYPMPIK